MDKLSLEVQRNISSSEDRCKCDLCRGVLDQNHLTKKLIPNISTYRHIKKREGPPQKKESNVKNSNSKNCN